MRAITTILIFTFLLPKAYGQVTESNLIITHLSDNFYVFTTFNLYKGNRIPANGMYLVTDESVVMFDTPWDTTQFQPLLDSIRIKHNKKVGMSFATHFHEDRTGGLEYYRQQGIKTYTTKKTDDYSKETGKKRAEFFMYQDTIFSVGGYSFQVYYPGHGHAPDNIVIWFQKERVLYGGCLIKSTVDNTLGNLGDANVKTYAATVKNVLEKCKRPKYIIPGHNDWSSTKSLKHTLKMAQQLLKENKN